MVNPRGACQFCLPKCKYCLKICKILIRIRLKCAQKLYFLASNENMFTQRSHIPAPVALTAPHQLQTLVENRKVYNLDTCELNIYETYQPAEKVPLKFDDLVITSMLRGKKRMHAQDDQLFDYKPGESLLWQANEWMVIDFPEAAANNPTQCIALTISHEEIQETIQYLTSVRPKPKRVARGN